MKESVYELLAAKVEPLIEHYREDLVRHDRESLEQYPGVPFLHWTRNLGTHLVFLPEARSDLYPPPGKRIPYLFGTAGRQHILNQIVEQARYWPDHDPGAVLSTHYFDGHKLQAIGLERAIQVAEDYRRGVERTWANLEARQLGRASGYPAAAAA